MKRKKLTMTFMMISYLWSLWLYEHISYQRFKGFKPPTDVKIVHCIGALYSDELPYEDRGFESRSGIQVLKKQNVSSPLTRNIQDCRDREIACSASDHHGSNFESRVLRTVSSHPSHHPQEALNNQFSLHMHEGGIKPYSFNLPTCIFCRCVHADEDSL